MCWTARKKGTPGSTADWTKLYALKSTFDAAGEINKEGLKVFWDIDIQNGTFKFDQISDLPEEFKVKEHVDILREDMLQITFPNGLLIDVGWRPCFSARGKFYIVAVMNEDWDDPIAQEKAPDVIETKNAIRKMINDLI